MSDYMTCSHCGQRIKLANGFTMTRNGVFHKQTCYPLAVKAMMEGLGKNDPPLQSVFR